MEFHKIEPVGSASVFMKKWIQYHETISNLDKAD